MKPISRSILFHPVGLSANNGANLIVNSLATPSSVRRSSKFGYITRLILLANVLALADKAQAHIVIGV